MFLVQMLPALQVILGRATRDVDVDIDLGREGRANKISRRQVGYFDFLDMVNSLFFFFFFLFVCLYAQYPEEGEGT